MLATGALILGCSSILSCKVFFWVCDYTGRLKALLVQQEAGFRVFFYDEQSRMKNSQDFGFVFQAGCKKRSWSPESEQPELH